MKHLFRRGKEKKWILPNSFAPKSEQRRVQIRELEHSMGRSVKSSFLFFSSPKGIPLFLVGGWGLDVRWPESLSGSTEEWPSVTKMDRNNISGIVAVFKKKKISLSLYIEIFIILYLWFVWIIFSFWERKKKIQIPSVFLGTSEWVPTFHTLDSVTWLFFL